MERLSNWSPVSGFSFGVEGWAYASGPRSSLRPMLALILAALLALPTSATAAESVTLNPEDDLQAIVDAHPSGTVYMLKAGTYRMQAIIPKDGDVFDGKGAAVLNGSRLLTAFERRGHLWVALNQTQKGLVFTGRMCQAGFPRCSRPEDLFIDDRPLRHVESLYEVLPGNWHFDYRNNKVYFADDPNGRKVEIGVTPQAFGGKASNVVLRNLTVEKYAAPFSAIDTEAGSGWTVENNVIQLNHSVGVTAGRNTKVVRNKIVRNGQQGIDGGGNGFLFEGNEIADNNYAGVSYEWEAGGGKVTETHEGAIIRGNCVHGNDGPGIWADENVVGLIIEDNVVFGNSANGIMYEISEDGVIRNNIVADNGKKAFHWFWGPQILVAGSSNVQVYGNLIDVHAEYGNAITIVAQNRSPRAVAAGNQIFNNTIIMRGIDAKIGAATDVAAYVKTVATKNGMRQNEYHTVNLTTPFWHWNNKDLSWSQMISEGQESGSTIDDRLPPKPRLDCAFLQLN